MKKKENHVGDNSNIEVSSLENTIISLLEQMAQQGSMLQLALNRLWRARNGKKLIDRNEALFLATDTIESTNYRCNLLKRDTLKRKNDDELRVSLKENFLNAKAVETIIELKNKGKL